MTERRNDDPNLDQNLDKEIKDYDNRESRNSNRRKIRDRENRGVPVYERATDIIPAGNNISWGAILAGAVTAAAVFTVLSLITAALGFGLFAPTSTHPLQDVGIGTGIWTAITLILSFLAGGFISGYAARSTGMLHGAITWAVTVLMLLVFVVNAIAQILGLAANVAGTVAETTVDVAGSVANVAGDAIGMGLDQAGKAISDVDTEKLQTDVEEYLADTDVPELQPDYLKNELEESRNEIGDAIKDIAVNPDNTNQIIDKLVKSLQDKAKTIADSADRDAIANSVAENTDLTETEAEEVTDNIYNGLQEANKNAQETLDNAAVTIENLKKETGEKIDEAKEGADKATNAVSIGSIITFLGLIIALLLSAYGGKIGEEKALEFIRKDTIR